MIQDRLLFYSRRHAHSQTITYQMRLEAGQYVVEEIIERFGPKYRLCEPLVINRAAFPTYSKAQAFLIELRQPKPLYKRRQMV